MRHLVRILCIACVTGSAVAQPVPSAPVPRIADVLGAIDQGDGARARDLLHALTEEGLDAREKELRSCMLQRLEGAAQPESKMSDVFTGRVLEAYEQYWQRGVMGASARAAAEATLLGELRQLLGNTKLQDIASAEPLIAERLQHAGYHSLQGKTGVLHELMIWSRQTEEQEQINLPEGTQLTHVFLLDGFVSRGWTSYLSCGRSGTGGWTKSEGLYAVVPAYKSLDDENFRVNFVAHESQHFADQLRFPGLKDWEKEYRAKLVELALADQTLGRALRYFASSQGDDPADAHSYANRQVMKSVRVTLGLPPDADLSSVSPDLLRQAAVATLRADSARREQQKHTPADAGG